MFFSCNRILRVLKPTSQPQMCAWWLFFFVCIECTCAYPPPQGFKEWAEGNDTGDFEMIHRSNFRIPTILSTFDSTLFLSGTSMELTSASTGGGGGPSCSRRRSTQRAAGTAPLSIQRANLNSSPKRAGGGLRSSVAAAVETASSEDASSGICHQIGNIPILCVENMDFTELRSPRDIPGPFLPPSPEAEV